MNAKSKLSEVTTQNPAEKSKPAITPEQLDEILYPEFSKDTFKLGSTIFRIRVLPWKWDAVFRRYAVPIITEELKPFERALYVLSSDAHLYAAELGIAASAGKSEVEGDKHLTNAICAICMSQDPVIAKAAAIGEEVPADQWAKLEMNYRVKIDDLALPDGRTRGYLREIVRKQGEKQNLVQALGESWMARLEEMSVLTGTKSTFDSLKQDCMRLVRSFMVKAGKLGAMSDNYSTPSTDSGSGTHQAAKPLPEVTTDQTTEEAEADPAEEQAVPAIAGRE